MIIDNHQNHQQSSFCCHLKAKFVLKSSNCHTHLCNKLLLLNMDIIRAEIAKKRKMLEDRKLVVSEGVFSKISFKFSNKNF